MAGPFKLDNQYANYAGHWAANTAYAQGKRVIAESANAGNARKYVFEATTGGTSQDPGPPTWDITPGNTTSDGTVTWTCREATTWTNAHGRMLWLALVPTAGEILHIDDSHAETGLSEIWAFNGVTGNPVKVICVDKATDLAVAGYATGATFIAEALCDVQIDGDVYFWGITITQKSSHYLAHTGHTVVLEQCKISIDRDAAISTDMNSDNATLIFINSDYEAIATIAPYIYLYRSAYFIWRGGTLIGNRTKLIKLSDFRGFVDISGVDLSSMVGGTLIALSAATEGTRIRLRGIKLNATSPDLITSGTAPFVGAEILMDIADNGNTVYKFRREYQYGYAQDETTKVITGKALYDGTNEFTVKMVSRATPTCSFYDSWRYHLTTLRETGFAANRTYTIHFAQDHADVQPDALDNNEIWIEVVYPDDSTAQFNIANDKIVTPTTTPAAQTTSTESWEGLAATTRLQELAVTINSADGKNGPVEIWVCIAKADKTIYVCPEVYVS